MQGSVVFVDIGNGIVCFQVAIGLQVCEAETPPEFVDECDDVFYFVADRISGFHGVISVYGCKLRIFCEFLVHLEQPCHDVGFGGVFGEAVGLQDGGIVGAVGLAEFGGHDYLVI